MTTKPEAEI